MGDLVSVVGTLGGVAFGAYLTHRIGDARDVKAEQRRRRVASRLVAAEIVKNRAIVARIQQDSRWTEADVLSETAWVAHRETLVLYLTPGDFGTVDWLYHGLMSLNAKAREVAANRSWGTIDITNDPDMPGLTEALDNYEPRLAAAAEVLAALWDETRPAN